MSLRHAAATGMKWSSTSMTLVTLLQLAKYFILARLLSAEDFGLMAMVIVVFSFGFAFADVGINKSLVHFNNTTQRQRSTLYWLNVGAGLTLSILIYLLSPLAIFIFRDPRLVDLLRLASLAFVTVTLGQQFQMLLQKELRFRMLAVVNVSSTLIGTSVAIVLAYLGQGVWALLWGSLSNFISRAAWFASVGLRQWPVKFEFELREVGKYLSFGLYELGTRLVITLYKSSDTLLIGTFLGPELLGYYSMAFYIAVVPMSKLAQVFGDVMFPILNRINEESDRLQRAFFRVLKFIMIISFPLMLGLFAIAPVLVPVVLGAKWMPSMPLIQIMSMVTLVYGLGVPIGPLLLAKGRADLNFRWHSSVALFHISGVAIGLIWGITGVAVIQLIMQVAYWFLSYFMLVRPLLGSCFEKFINVFRQPALVGVLMAIPVYFLPLLFAQMNIVLLVSQILLGAVIYSIFTFVLQRDEVNELVQLLLKR